VLWNLISNAVKFTGHGGKVDVLLEARGDAAEIRVTDTGVGIEPEFLPFVFDRFRQADATTTRRYGGLGLGLSIVKQLTEMHGGTVRVLSEGPGRGSTFIVTLPLARAADDAASTTAAAMRDESGLGDHDDVSGVHVLVVDDDSDARELVRRLLTECGANVVTADGVEAALARVKDTPIDVLVSDIGMPGQDGYDLIQAVRTLPDEAAAAVPALALTAYARPEDRVKAIRAGFQMHIAKPIEPRELIAMVASLARRIV
jgi:CheY-like chemotaxis protein/anti-sigma regulatory factor (Ser/Thr protein kinase)